VDKIRNKTFCTNSSLYSYATAKFTKFVWENLIKPCKIKKLSVKHVTQLAIASCWCIYISIHFSEYKDSYNYFKLIRNYKEMLWGLVVCGFLFEVLTAVGIEITVLWDVRPCSSAERLHESKQYFTFLFGFIILTAITECTACTKFCCFCCCCCYCYYSQGFCYCWLLYFVRKLLSEENVRSLSV